MLPGSGGLENDIGAISDIISRKRARIRPGMAEAQVFVRLNKQLMPANISQIPKLGSDWEQKIPNRSEIWNTYLQMQKEEEEEEDDLEEMN